MGEKADILSKYTGLQPFKKGQTGNPNGRPKGRLNKRTVALRTLEQRFYIPTHIFNELKKVFPDLKQELTVAEAGNIFIADKMIKGNVFAYEALMNAAYGRSAVMPEDPPEQEERLVFNIIIDSNILTSDKIE